MIKRIATVGGLTLVSRVTGFVRDVVMGSQGSHKNSAGERTSGNLHDGHVI